MRATNRVRRWTAIAALAIGSTGIAAAAPDAQQTRNDYGISLSLGGQPERAESVFVAMLSEVRGDPRALTNLGNLKFMRGDLGVALAFYDRALRADSLDPGIHLNRAATLLRMGDDARAEQAAVRGITLAGSSAMAEELLGLSSEPVPAEAKGAEKKSVSREELQALLKKAAKAVPKKAPAAAPPATTSATKPGQTWRSAGPRSSAAIPAAGDTATLLYWKHGV
jgi:tetratricopeptide (TPR) repeat protein